MKLLYVAIHQLWPLTTGARLRDYHLARQLASRCSLTFFEILHEGDSENARPPDDTGFAEIISIRKDRGYTGTKLLRGFIGPKPIHIVNLSSVRISAVLTDILTRHRFDAVQIENIQLSQYLPVIQNAPGRPSVLADWHNIESEVMSRYAGTASGFFRRIVGRRTAGLLRSVERQYLEECRAHTVPSERERRTLLEWSPNANVQVIPNGVDVGHFTPQAKCDSGARPSLLFVGSMDYHANIDAVRWFCDRIWPEVAKRHAELDFTIVGRNPSSEVRALASARIHVTGTVEDVRPFYNQALAVVVPLRVGGGTRLKILEAMAARVPVVSTRLGAEGIDAQHDVDILLADTVQETIAAIDRVVMSLETRERLVEAAHQLVDRRYDWSIIGDQLYRIHCNLIQEATPSPLSQ